MLGTPPSSSRWRILLAIAALVPLALALAGCGSSSATTSSTPTAVAPASIDTLTATSKNEKGLVIYGNPPPAFFKPVVEAFKAKYPWISVESTNLADNQVFSKYQAEHAQSARTADLLIASSPQSFVQAVDAGVVANVTPEGLSNFPSDINQGHGVYVMSPEPVIFAYNTKLLTGSAIPTSYADLAKAAKADPAKYPLTTYTIDNQLNEAAIYGLIHVLGDSTTWSIYDKLAPNSKTYSEGVDEVTQVATGAASAAYVVSGLGQVAIPLQTHGLVGFSYMQDATPLVPRGIAVTSGAASPASAQLFLDFIFSDPGQQVLCAAGFEASMNGFTPAGSCVANLTTLQSKVPAKAIYLVPFSKDLVNAIPGITTRWNQSFHR
jgi:iron(III) transport system substrate-binding protein